MIDRRELLFGLGCIGAVGSAEWLRPRRYLRLMPPGQKLSRLIPEKFDGWFAGAGGDIVLPETPGSLASRLYDDRVARTYTSTGQAQATEVMLLAAYGAAQNDLLQLHRPEVCYPAIGMRIVRRRLVLLPVISSIVLPAVMLTAEASGRIEDIVYWTRLGEKLPQTGSEQRMARLMAAFHGLVSDGVLIRTSALRNGGAEQPQFDLLTGFVQAMILGAAATARPALIGTALADALSKVEKDRSVPPVAG